MDDHLVKFVVLSGPRTGSTLLASSLQSHPFIVCFREVFNFLTEYVPFDVDGYDNYDPDDLKRRNDDAAGFLDDRIFSGHADSVRAAGLKIHYGQFIGFSGLQERLVEDGSIRIVHLKRRNHLRALVSAKKAEATGLFWQDAEARPMLPRLFHAARHPFRAASGLRARLQRPKVGPAEGPLKMRVSPQELFDFIIKTNQQIRYHEDLFQAHQILAVFFEDMADRPQEVFGDVQAFLGLDPTQLDISLRRQNPQPLDELIENFEELREASQNSPNEFMFE